MRINKMITQEKRPWSYIKFSQLILKGNVWRSVWRICMLIFGLKGLMYKGHSLAAVSHKLTSNLFPCQCYRVYNQKVITRKYFND